MSLEPVSVLEGLLRHFSPTGLESHAVAFLVDQMNQSGFQAYIDEIGNAVGKIGNGNREILLLGHIDTVPGEIAVRTENGILHGRGAVDAKGPLSSFVCAAARARLAPDWRISVISAIAEEGDSRGAKYLCDTYPAPDFVVIGEPSGWESITLGYKGSHWMDFIFNQPVSHTASSSGSAGDKAFIFWNEILRIIDETNLNKIRVFDQITPSIRGLHTDFDGFLEKACIKANFRVPVNITQEYILNLLDGCTVSTGIQPEVKEFEYIPAYLSEKNSPLVRAFLSGIRKAGGNPGFKLKTGTSDMNIVGPIWNVPIVAYGGGDSNLDHTPDEHIQLSEYLSGIDVLVNSLEKLQGFVD
jgi:LysW-gamma-L-lysine carboxypeptidase